MENMTKEKFFVISMEFGNFQKCGFYDWKLFTLQPNGKLKGTSKIYSLKNLGNQIVGDSNNYDKLNTLLTNPMIIKTKPVQGRFIVQPKNVKELQFHEIYPDMLDDMLPKSDDDEKIKGSYCNLKDSLNIFSEMGINCLYLLGVVERDLEKEKYLRPKGENGCPLSITNRANLNTELGTKEDFLKMIEIANSLDMMILSDLTVKISSSRPNRKYWPVFLEKIDEEGIKNRLLGSDGKANHFEDSLIPNYRKKKSWDLLISDAIEFVQKYKVHGIHLNDSHNWPPLYKPNLRELQRKELINENLVQIYTEKEIFEGAVVLTSENCGFWETSDELDYSNPFLVKLCRELWTQFPHLLIVGEVWIGRENEVREAMIAQSGPIPRIYVLPPAISRLIRETHQESVHKSNCIMLLGLLENFKKSWPKNSIIIQSTCSHIWQYPHRLFKEGLKAAIDLFFFLPMVPGTFLGEYLQCSERPKILNIFKRVSKDLSKKLSYTHESRNLFTESNTEQKLLSDSSFSSDFSHNELRSIPSGVTFSIFYLESIHNEDKAPKLEEEADIFEFFSLIKTLFRKKRAPEILQCSEIWKIDWIDC